jgi:DNA polymerase-3 subunit epsilon
MKVFWFDTETGGLDPQKNPILQLAYVVEIDGQEVEHGEMRCSGFPGCEITDIALEINRLDRVAVGTYPDELYLYNRLMEVFTRYVNKFDRNDKFVAGGYNVQFDMGFLRAVWDRRGDKYMGSWFQFGTIDPSNLVRILQYKGMYKDLGTKLTLERIADFFGVPRDNAHDAEADIRMTIDVTKAILLHVC